MSNAALKSEIAALPQMSAALVDGSEAVGAAVARLFVEDGIDEPVAETPLQIRRRRVKAEIAAREAARPSREEAEAAVAVLIRWAGDDPTREGMLKTPARVAKAFREMFAGYDQDETEELDTVFEDVGGYRDPVIVRDIEFHSHCEHHTVPFVGHATIGYIPNEKGGVVGLSKLARLTDVFARRYQTQETMTAQIADAMQDCLDPQGIAVVVRAAHQCMSCRGVRKQGSTTVTTTFRGRYRDDKDERAQFMCMAGGFGDR